MSALILLNFFGGDLRGPTWKLKDRFNDKCRYILICIHFQKLFSGAKFDQRTIEKTLIRSILVSQSVYFRNSTH